MTRGPWFAGAASAAMLAAFFLAVFHDRYWRHRDCFNELGRCWSEEEQQVFVEAAGWIWGAPALAFAVGAVLLLVGALRHPPG